jgi:hypothetical protein
MAKVFLLKRLPREGQRVALTIDGDEWVGEVSAVNDDGIVIWTAGPNDDGSNDLSLHLWDWTRVERCEVIEQCEVIQ